MASSREPASRRRKTLVVALAVYLVVLAWAVLWKLEVPWFGAAAGLDRPLKLIPFFPDGNADASAPGEVIVNVILFVPLGLFLGALAPWWKWWRAGLVGLLVSLVLETVQHVLSTGSFDTTDLITNAAGAIVGWVLFLAVRRRAAEKTPAVMTRVCVTASALALVAAIAFAMSPLHYGPQRDVVVDRSSSTTT